MKTTSLVLSALFCLTGPALRAEPACANDVRLQGRVAKAMALCLKNHVAATDALYLTKPFHARQETHLWQSEFWGKWMLSAVPFAAHDGDEQLKTAIAASVKDVISTQDVDGYIGNYRRDRRYGHGCWDVWGTKYTLSGLALAAQADGVLDDGLRRDALVAADRLGFCLMRTFGSATEKGFEPSGDVRPLCLTGWYRGMPSCSVLEPIVVMYRLTGKRAYLDFARYIVSQMDEDAGARLLKDCEMPVFLRLTNGGLDSSLKAYEMMSCYQGMLELSDELSKTGDAADAAVAKRLLFAAKSTAQHILDEEINIVGGAASGEHWYSGREKQAWNYNRQNETCVLTTWMRLCQKLYGETGETAWLDALEQCFYNAYLATMKPDGSAFAQYTPLAGTRTTGEHHCHMHTNCCNANGPRGFLVFLESVLAAKGDAVFLNLYASGHLSADVPSLGENVDFYVYTEYPKNGRVEIWYRSDAARTFTLALRVPGWCKSWRLEVNGERKTGNGEIALARTWQPGDKVVLELEMNVVSHVLDGHIAFTFGPVALARDSRWATDIGETIRPAFAADGSGETTQPDIADLPLVFTPVEPEGAFLAFDAILPVGVHSESVDGKMSKTVRFVDFASAGSTWDARSSYRTWLPVLRFESRR